MLTTKVDGHYDAEGHWVRTKLCLVYCGDDKYTCRPPNEEWIKPQVVNVETKGHKDHGQ